MRSFQIQSVLDDPALAAEVVALGDRTAGGAVEGEGRASRAGRTGATGGHRSAASAATAATERAVPPGLAPLGGSGLVDSEAAALAGWLARPSLAVGDRTFEAPVATAWQARLLPTARRLTVAAASVGRVEVDGSADALGSAWVLAPGVVATSPTVLAAVRLARAAGRVVRVAFADRSAGVGPPGPRVTAAEVAVPRAGTAVGRPDDAAGPAAVGLLRFDPADEPTLPPPLALLDASPDDVDWVALLSCPHEADGAAGGASRGARPGDGKRLAPGRWSAQGHDASASAGSEGGALVDVTTAAVVGLHLADGRGGPHPVLPARAVLAGLAAAVPTAAPVLRLAGTPRHAGPGASTTGAQPVSTGEATRAVVPADALAGRSGYRDDFLGSGELRVPLPTVPSALARELVVVDAEARGTKRYVLAYEHYVSVMHRPRRMPVFTASNIDGAQAEAIKRRRDNWSLDPRIPADTQWGGELYSDNDLDRGHLTRRLDPAWGATAEVAEADTFFYTNACPQQHRFNDGVWGDLEDYLLHNADTLDFRACVFTGPVFGDTDLPYRGALIPLRFWKVAVMVHAERRQLSATGYLLSQADLLGTREFVFGQFRTYQVSLRELEQLSGLRWSALRPFDPLEAAAPRGARARPAPRELRELGDLVL